MNIMLGIMAFTLFFSASASAKDAVYERISLSQMVKTRALRWVEMSIPENMKVYELRRYHIKNQIIKFCVLDKDGQKKFTFSELDLEKIRNNVSSVLNIGKLEVLLKQKGKSSCDN